MKSLVWVRLRRLDGVTFEIAADGDELALRADEPPPDAILAILRERKADLLAILDSLNGNVSDERQRSASEPPTASQILTIAEQAGYRLAISDDLRLTTTRPPMPSIVLEELLRRQKAEVIERLKYERDAVRRWIGGS